jgi:transcriptional regulator with XRE-family HTH domain
MCLRINTTNVVVDGLYKSYERRSMAEQDKVGISRDVWATRFKEARLASGLSQKQVGIGAGLDEFVASTRINRYELGVHQADYPMSIRLAQVLSVPVAYLYCDSDEFARLLLAFHRAPKAVRRVAVKLLTEAVGD